MKTLLTLPFLLLSLVSFPSWSETMSDLVEREGIYYKKFSDVPFTGEIKSQTESGGIKAGEREGPWITYWDNGQLRSGGDHKNGTEDGTWVEYYENGQLSWKGDLKDGKEEGSWIWYFPDGQLMMKGDYKNGEREGSWVSYFEDGTFDEYRSGVYKDGVKISD